MGEPAQAYRALRARVTLMCETTDPAALERIAPATPEWRVRDVLAHLVGVANDVVAGRLEGVTSEPWTAAQVEPRRDVPIADLLAEWSGIGPRFEALLDEFEPAGQALYDAATHEHDVRHALGVQGARESDAIALAWKWFLPVRGTVRPTVRLVTECGEEVSGSGEPVATIEAPRFELFRAFTGRRTADEIGSYGWDCEPDPDLLVVAQIFTMRTESLNE